MKLKIKNKKNIIVGIIIIFLIIISIYYGNNIWSDLIKENAYIDIWENKPMIDIDLESRGSGVFEELYLGYQPVHYLINKNGKIYSYRAGEFKNKLTKRKNTAMLKSIKKISQTQMDDLINDLKKVIEKNSVEFGIGLMFKYPTIWHIKLQGEKYTINTDIQYSILNKYIGEKDIL